MIETDRIYMKVDKRYDYKCLLLLLGYSAATAVDEYLHSIASPH